MKNYSADKRHCLMPKQKYKTDFKNIFCLNLPLSSPYAWRWRFFCVLLYSNDPREKYNRLGLDKEP